MDISESVVLDTTPSEEYLTGSRRWEETHTYTRCIQIGEVCVCVCEIKYKKMGRKTKHRVFAVNKFRLVSLYGAGRNGILAFKHRLS